METVSGGACVLESVVNRVDSVCRVDCKAFEDSTKTCSVDPGWTYGCCYQPDSVLESKLTKLSLLECKGTGYGIAWFDCVSLRFHASIKVEIHGI
jgi:hypothetical protein